MGEQRDGECGERLLAIYPSLRRFAAVIGSSDMSPDDLVHDAIVAALKRGRLNHVDDVEAYLRRTVVHLAANERRRLGRQRSSIRRVGAGLDGPAVSDVYPSGLAHLAELEPRSRAVLYLHYVEGRSFAQIADLMKLRPATVRQIGHRARHLLRLNDGVTP